MSVSSVKRPNKTDRTHELDHTDGWVEIRRGEGVGTGKGGGGGPTNKKTRRWERSGDSPISIYSNITQRLIIRVIKQIEKSRRGSGINKFFFFVSFFQSPKLLLVNTPRPPTPHLPIFPLPQQMQNEKCEKQ